MSVSHVAPDKHNQQHEHPHVPYSTYVKVWGTLLVFTGITILAALVHLGQISTIVAVLIASVKASLVLYFFMGLKYEPPIFRYFFLITAISIGIFFVLTFVDTEIRYRPVPAAVQSEDGHGEEAHGTESEPAAAEEQHEAENTGGDH